MDLLGVAPREFERGQVFLKREVRKLDALAARRQNPAVRFFNAQAAQRILCRQQRVEHVGGLTHFQRPDTPAL
jgi:hypothetical protein